MAPTDRSDVEAMVRWSNDSEIRHLFRRFKDERDYAQELRAAPVQARLAQVLSSGSKLVYIIELDGEAVGEVSCELDAPHLHHPVANTAWIGLVIGEAHARGRGLGEKAMRHIEARARERGAERAEVGVFEFNERAIALYSKLGYREFARIDEFTWWKGKKWTDIRMAKRL
jgi:RimJ/RimL family protein N-acetyltransferase